MILFDHSGFQQSRASFLSPSIIVYSLGRNSVPLYNPTKVDWGGVTFSRLQLLIPFTKLQPTARRLDIVIANRSPEPGPCHISLFTRRDTCAQQVFRPTENFHDTLRVYV